MCNTIVTRVQNDRRTDPAAFRNPYGLGNKLGRVLWRVAYCLLFRPTPARLFVRWRASLLRLFGARLGRVWIHPRARVWAPWLLTAGDDVYIDEGVYLYNPFGIEIGDRVIISMEVFLCTASHDHERPDYPLIGGRIVIGSDTWLAAQVFVGPGVTVGEGAVVGARSCAVRDVPPWSVAVGNPARAVDKRVLRLAGAGGNDDQETQ